MKGMTDKELLEAIGKLTVEIQQHAFALQRNPETKATAPPVEEPAAPVEYKGNTIPKGNVIPAKSAAEFAVRLVGCWEGNTFDWHGAAEAKARSGSSASRVTCSSGCFRAAYPGRQGLHGAPADRLRRRILPRDHRAQCHAARDYVRHGASVRLRLRGQQRGEQPIFLQDGRRQRGPP